MFELLKTSASSAARRGKLTTAHGAVQTPVFMPVGTQATVKSLTPAQVEETGAQIMLSNTYHLNIRPGADLIESFGGLHGFMKWEKPILTDSGGFQVFSLSKLRKIKEDGIYFSSHLDGSKLFLSPESCMEIQMKLGSDICMVLDECIPYPSKKDFVETSTDRTIRWAKRCLEHADKIGLPERNRLSFAIVQGSNFEDVRARCAQELSALNFPGYAIGGVSVGEPEEEMLLQVAASAPHLPQDKPRYVMGVGTPVQLLKMIALGADMFDCVMPTRLARHANAFTKDGVLNLRNAKFAADKAPLDESLLNYTTNFSRAYLRHLVMSDEMLGCTLLSIHNIHFFQDLMAQARSHIESGDFETWSTAWISRYNSKEA